MIRAALLAVTLATPAMAQDTMSADAVWLRGLDKLSGTSWDVKAERGANAEFGDLNISVAECRYPSGDPASDAYAHVRISQGTDALFQGWMIASAPALNAIDHPRYDIWVIRCITS